MNVGAAVQGSFEVMLEASFSAAILAVIVAMVQLLLRGRLSPAWRFALWTPVLLRLFVPVLPESAFSLFNAPRWYASWRAESQEPVSEPAGSVTPIMIVTPEPTQMPFELAADVVPAIEPAAAAGDEQPPVPTAKIDLWAVAAVLWGCGLVLFLSRLGIGTLWMSLRLRASARNAHASLDEVMRDVARAGKFRARPSLRETDLVESPALFGLWRPVLLLPPGFSDRLSETEIRYVFLHELAHLKRRDLMVNWLMSIAQALHWFNPLVWLVFRRMRLERELACDEMALRACIASDPKAYGETILRLLEGVSARPALSALVGVAEEKHSAKQRLQQIASFRNRRRKYWLGVPVLIGVVLVGLTNAQAPKKTGEVAPERIENAPTVENPELGDLLADSRIDYLQWDGTTLTEALADLRKKLPSDLEAVTFIWNQTTNITSDPEGRYSVRASGHINTEIGTQATPADELRLSRRHLEDSHGSFGGLQISEAARVTWSQSDSRVLRALSILIRAAEKPILCIVDLNRITFRFAETSQDTANRLVNDARTLIEMGKRAEAKVRLERVLEIDPNHRAAKYYLKLAEENPPQRSAIPNKKGPNTESGSAGVLTNEGRLLLEMGKVDEAEAKFKEAQKLHPQGASLYYLKLIEERRSLELKLDGIDQIDLEGLTVAEAIEAIKKKLPTELGDIQFRWYQTTNMSSGKIPREDGTSAVYAVNAIGYIETEIGKNDTPADTIRISRRHLAERTGLENLTLRPGEIRAKGALDLVALAAEQPIVCTIHTNWVTFRFVETPQDKVLLLLMEGGTLMKSGNILEAKVKFQEVLRIDPNNRPAQYYLSLTEERLPSVFRGIPNEKVGVSRAPGPREGDAEPGRSAKPLSPVTGDGSLDESRTPVQGSLGFVTRKPGTLEEKLDGVRIDRIDLEGLTLTEALDKIREKLPAELREIAFSWYQTTNLTSGRAAGSRTEIESAVNESAVYSVNAIGYITSRIGKTDSPADGIRLSHKHLSETNEVRELKVRNLPVVPLLELIRDAAEKPLRYWVVGNSLVFSFGERPDQSWRNSIPLSQPEDRLVALILDGRTLLEMGKVQEAKSKFEEAIRIDPKSRQAQYYLGVIEERANSPAARERERPVSTSVPNAARRAVLRKLNEIQISMYEVYDVSLLQAIKDLSAISRKLDPEGTGVNLIASREPLDRSAGTEFVPMVEDFRIVINPPLRNVRLIDVLDAITRVAIPPSTTGPRMSLKYSIEDYGVVFNYREDKPEPLYTRSYRVDPNTFVQGLDGVFLQRNPLQQIPPGGSGGAGGAIEGPGGGGAGGYFIFDGSGGVGGVPAGGGILGVTITNSMSTIQDAVRNFFIAAGIDFQTSQQAFAGGGAGDFGGQPAPPQKAIYFNDRRGILLVRATLRDLDMVEKALQTLHVIPSQVTLRTEQIKLKDKKEFEYLTKVLAEIQGEFRPALTELEFRKFKREVEKGDRFLVRLQTVTTLSSRPARTSLDEHAVDVRPTYVERNNSFKIEATSFDLNNKPKTVTRHGAIYDGQTFIVMPSSEGNGSPQYITFITAELVDPAGNRVHAPEQNPISNERTPPQE